MAVQAITGIAFPFRFTGSGGVATSTTSQDEFTHLEEDIKQLLNTRLGERPFRPTYGTELYTNVFNPEDETTVALIESNIRDALALMSEVIEVLGIDLYTDEGGSGDDGQVFADIDIYVKKFMASDTVTVSIPTAGGAN